MYWDPWDDWEYWNKRMRRMMRGFLLPIRDEFLEGSFPVDVKEDEKDLIIIADLPGFDKTDMAIRATEDSVEIVAQHKEQKKERTERMYREERRYGALRRYLTLPVKVNPETAKAKMDKGILVVRLEKKEKKKVGKEIKVE